MLLDDAETRDVEQRLRDLEAENMRLRGRLFARGETSVVKGPEPLQSLFDEAQVEVHRYFETLRTDPSQASIDVHGDRYILLRGASLGVDFFQIVRGIFPRSETNEADDFAARLLYDLSHGAGRNDQASLVETMGLEGAESQLSAGPVNFAYTGWAKVEILPESNTEPGDDFVFLYRHLRSFEAESWLDAGREVDHPVCAMNAGYSAGWCEQSFGLHLESVEVTCRARGDEHCCFVLAPPHQLKRQLARLHRERPDLVPDGSVDSGRDFLSRRELAAAARREDRTATTRMRSERRLLAYAHALEATRDMLHRKVSELEQENHWRRDAQKKLESTQRTLDEIDLAVLWVDPDQNLLYANQAAGQLFGYERDELLSHSFRDLVAEDPERLQREQSSLLETEGSSVVQEWMQHSSGRKFAVEIHSVAQRDSTRAFHFCFIEDITERLVDERQRLQSMREPEKKADNSSTLLSTLSHEIRTPLTSIVATVDLLRAALGEGELKDIAETAADASDHLLHLVERMLDYSRAEAEPLDDLTRVVDLEEWIARVTRMLEPKALERGIQLKTEFGGGLPQSILADTGSLRQILLNLTNNAIKATAEGSVTVRVEALYVDEEFAQLQWEVTDTGSGIEAEDQALLFQPFTPVGAEGRRKEGGAGLGLAISQRLCERMGSHLAVRSQVGRGSTFWFAAGVRRPNETIIA